MREGDEFWLESSCFDELREASAVQTAARDLLVGINGAAKLIDGSFRAVELQNRFSDGVGTHQFLTVDAVESRERAGAVIVAETEIGLFKTELIHRQGPWQNVDAVELATLGWVDWHNQRRLHNACHDLTPVEYEQIYYGQHPALAEVLVPTS